MNWLASEAIRALGPEKVEMSGTGFETVKKGIRTAALAAGRDPKSITLVAVSKTFEAREISPVIDAGHRVFGENRVQEAKRKWPALKAERSGLQLHLIGPLQSNKAAEAVNLFDAIHTIDRPKIAEAVAVQMSRQGRVLELFVQVNTGLEPQKAGVSPADAERFIRQCRTELGLPISGLMCIPPVDDDPVPHFKLLARLAADNGLSNLSMGMSSDYVEAIQCGATHLRIGSAIFGSRQPMSQP